MRINLRQFYAASALVLQASALIIVIYLVYTFVPRCTFGFPLVFEGVFQIICSEVNHYKQERRYRCVKEQEDLGEKGVACAECVGTVIGYREDPDLFRQCLQSYRDDASKTFKSLVIGIDGNESEDLKMVEMAQKVYGTANITVIKLEETFGSLAMQMIDDWTTQRSGGDRPQLLDKHKFLEHVFRVLVQRAAAVLQDLNLLNDLGSNDNPKAICVTQPHVSKKEIMFSSFLFALALTRTHDIPFIWSSDSDSYFDPATAPVHLVLASMAADPTIGGSCGALKIHNAGESTVTRLAAATYWTDLALTSGQNSAFNVTDCQPGPCAAFASAVLADVLVPWYAQTFLGVRPVVNEDRHLTTLLLAHGHRTTFHPRATVMTDAPTTLAAWIAQQVRWTRAIVIETAAHPRVLATRSPVLALYAARRLAFPFLQARVVVRYLALGAGVAFAKHTGTDIAARVLLCTGYTVVAGRRRGGAEWRLWPWLCASQFFLQFAQPPIVLWASATFLDGSWGNEARKGVAVAEDKSAVWTILAGLRKTWAPLIIVSLWVGLLAAAICKFAASMALVGSEDICAVAGGLVFGTGMLYWFIKK